MNNAPPPPEEDLQAAIRSIKARLRILSVAVLIMALALLLSAAATLGSLVNYFAGDAMFFGAIAVGAAVLGFAFGWLGRRSA